MAIETYSLSVDMLGYVNESRLHKVVSENATITTQVDAVSVAGDVVQIHFSSPISGAEKTELDSVVASHSLEAAKAVKSSEIDGRTDQLISVGFPYNGEMYELNHLAQIRVLGIFIIDLYQQLEAANAALNATLGGDLVVNEPGLDLPFPLEWNSADDFASESLADSNETRVFAITALGTMLTHYNSGTALKAQVRSAADIPTVEAIVDPR